MRAILDSNSEEAWEGQRGDRELTQLARDHTENTRHYKLVLCYPEKGPTSCRVNKHSLSDSY